MKFYSGKGLISIALIVLLTTMDILGFIFKAYVPACIMTVVLCYFVWMWFDTWYRVDGNQFLYKSALIKGSIDISTIFEVVKNKTLFSGLKPSLSTKGIIVKYNKWDDIYISPANIDLFISALKNVNPGIKTVE